MKKASVVKPFKENHTSNAKKGMGDHYGTGIKQKVGRMISGAGINPLPKGKLKNPPKSVA